MPLRLGDQIQDGSGQVWAVTATEYSAHLATRYTLRTEYDDGSYRVQTNLTERAIRPLALNPLDLEDRA